MSDILSGTSKFARDLAEALGLKDCRSIELRVAVDEAVTLKTETLVCDEAGARVLETIRRFEMIERIEVVDVSTLDCDSRKYIPSIDAVGGVGCKASTQTLKP